MVRDRSEGTPLSAAGSVDGPLGDGTLIDRPVEHIAECAESRRRLLATIESLTDDQASAPSLLPGWSRGHVLTHLARKTDSFVWLLGGACAGEVREQYPEPGMRERDIEAGAGRSATELREDVAAAFDRFEAAVSVFPDDLWGWTGIVQPGARTMAETVFRHLRDLEVHHVDLGLGYAPSDWPAVYVEGELMRRLAGLPDRAERSALVAWLLGRAEAPELSGW